MICSACGADNRAGRKFCAQCAAPLALVCPSCAAPNEPGERYCGECAYPLDAAPAPSARPAPSAAPAAERRLVTVLFADLVGFTSLSEQRDPEEVRELLTRYFDTAQDIVVRYGGMVEKFVGDAVMAVWGAPVSHEDDAERAVRAALDLVEGIPRLGRSNGVDLQLRAGVLTGEAAVTLGAPGQGMVAGDLVNTAARLQTAAAPCTVLVGRSTYHAARNAISFEEAGPHTLKGKELPVDAWRAVNAVAGRRGVGRSESLEPPFVGRDEDLRVVKDLLHATAREGRVRLVSITGTPGIGKSRLAWELEKYVDGLVQSFFWHAGHCPAYGEGVTFWALGEMVRMRARIAEAEDARSSRDKLEAAVADHVADPDERRWIELRLAHLLALDEAPGEEREDLFAAWRRFFEHISERGPVVMVFEDLQWADSGLLDFIEHTLEWGRDHPILLVTLARPELLDRRPHWGAGQRNFTSVHLDALSDGAMRELLSGVSKDLPDDLVDQVVERAEGVPLYAVEMLRSLVDEDHLRVEDGTHRLVSLPERLAVPDSLHSLIAARLDALEPRERALLQDASVLGKTFTLEALAALEKQPPAEVEPRLKALVRRELLTVESDPWSPERGHHGFVQTLIREIAYGTLSRRDRKARHIGAADYLEALEDDELASVVATHLLAAHALADERDAAELAERSRAALLRAAERAASLGAHRQSLGHLEQAMDLAADAGDRAGLWERAAEAAQKAADLDTAERYLRQTIEWYQQRGDKTGLARAKARLGGVLVGRGRMDPALALLEEALAPIADLGSDPAVIEMAEELARIYMIRGEPAPAIEWADRVLDAAGHLDLPRSIAGALTTKAVALYGSRRWREGVVIVAGVIELCRENELIPQETRALSNMAFMLDPIDPERALSAALRGSELAAKLGRRDLELISTVNALEAAMTVGRWDLVDTTIASLRQGELPELSGVELAVIEAWVSALRGDTTKARAALDGVRPLVHDMSSPQTLGQIFLGDAIVALAEGDLHAAYDAGTSSVELDPDGYGVKAQTYAAQAALWMRDTDLVASLGEGMEVTGDHRPWCEATRLTVKAGLAALKGRTEEAMASYEQATDAWRDYGAPLELALSQLDAALFLGPAGVDVEAPAREARDIFERLGAKPFLARLDEQRVEA